MEREVQEGGDICIHKADSLVVQQKLTQHCNATIPPIKKKKNLYFRGCPIPGLPESLNQIRPVLSYVTKKYF